MTEYKSPMDPALQALRRVRTEISKRVGSDGGHLKKEIMNELNTIEATLLQVVPIGEMMRVLNQQTEVAVSSFRALERLSLAATSQLRLPDNGGDDGTSDVKGQ
jgi:hypothetical protein